MTRIPSSNEVSRQQQQQQQQKAAAQKQQADAELVPGHPHLSTHRSMAGVSLTPAGTVERDRITLSQKARLQAASDGQQAPEQVPQESWETPISQPEAPVSTNMESQQLRPEQKAKLAELLRKLRGLPDQKNMEQAGPMEISDPFGGISAKDRDAAFLRKYPRVAISTRDVYNRPTLKQAAPLQGGPEKGLSGESAVDNPEDQD